MRNRAKFRADRSNRCRDIAIFGFSGWRSPPFRIFKFQICNGHNGQEGRTASLQNFVEIAVTAADIWRFFDFQNGGCRHVGFLRLQISNCWTRHEWQIA